MVRRARNCSDSRECGRAQNKAHHKHFCRASRIKHVSFQMCEKKIWKALFMLLVSELISTPDADGH